MRTPVIFDGRNLFDPGRMSELGMEYTGIGRPAVGRAAGMLAR
jgi:UDPglucose 6-dehydrogenase